MGERNELKEREGNREDVGESTHGANPVWFAAFVTPPKVAKSSENGRKKCAVCYVGLTTMTCKVSYPSELGWAIIFHSLNRGRKFECVLGTLSIPIGKQNHDFFAVVHR